MRTLNLAERIILSGAQKRAFSPEFAPGSTCLPHRSTNSRPNLQMQKRQQMHNSQQRSKQRLMGRTHNAAHNNVQMDGIHGQRLCFFRSIMILPQVHLRKPCYDFCPVQATAIKAVSTKESPPRRVSKQQSPHFSKRLSPGQRRAVCTKGRDVINVS